MPRVDPSSGSGTVERDGETVVGARGWYHRALTHARRFEAVQRAFIQSLVWRDAKAFGKGAFEYVDSLLRTAWAGPDLFDAMLMVAPVPRHPLNADKLHDLLSPHRMPERDAWWSVFLHGEWRAQRAVDRLVDWAWADSGRMPASDDVVILAGTALAWFLTSSNRFLRDRTTKALVSLFDDKLLLLARLLKKFESVDDPYVTERLIAVAYGCAMRSKNSTGLLEIAQQVVAQVFRNTELIPQLLTRDFARGVVELAKTKGVIAVDAFPESIPPYLSRWPGIKIPSAKKLENWGKWCPEMGPGKSAQTEVYSSIMGNGLSDFSNYVIDDLGEWTSVRIGSQQPKSTKRQYEDFRTNLTLKQRSMLDRLETVFENVRWYLGLKREERSKHLKSDFTDEDLLAARALLEDDFVKLISRSPAKHRLYNDLVRPYLENPPEFQRENPFDAEAARRWMVQRVIDYGWTSELFGRFDATIGQGRYDGRTNHKAERIGKKYQWIAYYELLARLSDNFYLREDRYNGDGFKLCSGIWDIGYRNMRNIDPSVTLPSTAAKQMEHAACWWSPVSYTKWNLSQEGPTWLRFGGDLPSLPNLVRVSRREDASEWFVLDTHLNWREPTRPGWKSYDRSQRSLYYIVKSYFVAKAESVAFFRWAKTQNFMGRWMPEPYDVYSIALGEFYWSPSFKAWASDAQIELSAHLFCDISEFPTAWRGSGS